MFLENVKHILKVNNGHVIEYIKDKLDKNNYNVQILEMSPHKYGIPQQRERVYFICVRKDIYKQPVELLEPETDVNNFNNYLDKIDTIDPKYFINGELFFY